MAWKEILAESVAVRWSLHCNEAADTFQSFLARVSETIQASSLKLIKNKSFQIPWNHNRQSHRIS